MCGFPGLREVSENSDKRVRQISCKGSTKALYSWEPHLNQKDIALKERSRLIGLLSYRISQNALLLRPDRTEPRAVRCVYWMIMAYCMLDKTH